MRLTNCRAFNEDAYDFNPRTPRGVRRFCRCIFKINKPISIHAPREGCDGGGDFSPPCLCYFNPRTPRGVRQKQLQLLTWWTEFQSTHPARGATSIYKFGTVFVDISIHAPREGCDPTLCDCIDTIGNFNPRTPRGVRLAANCSSSISRDTFQSTHPARGATQRLRMHLLKC